MFYYLAKVFWLLVQPLDLVLILLVLGLVTLALSRRRTAAAAVTLGLLVLALSAWTTLGALMLHPLEDRFAHRTRRPAMSTASSCWAAACRAASTWRAAATSSTPAATASSTRAVLARRYPRRGSSSRAAMASLLFEAEGDADTAPRLLAALGVAPTGCAREGRATPTRTPFSRRDWSSPTAGETWLLVTSAFHMPRAYALFRKAGFAVVPWPVDYRTLRRRDLRDDRRRPRRFACRHLGRDSRMAGAGGLSADRAASTRCCRGRRTTIERATIPPLPLNGELKMVFQQAVDFIDMTLRKLARSVHKIATISPRFALRKRARNAKSARVTGGLPRRSPPTKFETKTGNHGR